MAGCCQGWSRPTIRSQRSGPTVPIARSETRNGWLRRCWSAGSIATSQSGKPLPQNIARANAAKSSIRAAVEHVFAHQTNRFGLFIRTIGIARADAKLFLVKITYNIERLIFHERARAAG